MNINEQYKFIFLLHTLELMESSLGLSDSPFESRLQDFFLESLSKLILKNNNLKLKVRIEK